LDLAVVGGGIVGLATAHRYLYLESPAGRSVLVLEKEGELSAHQTGHNSGVIHSGLYYRPGSLKARICREGVEALVRFCDANGVAYEMCGKLIVATDERERERLEGLMDRGRRNGVPGLRRLSRSEFREIEPHADGVEAIHSPRTGIVSFREVAECLADRIRERDGRVLLNAAVTAITERSESVVVSSAAGDFESRRVVVCAGLFADRVLRVSGGTTDLRILPFRGEYYRLRPESRHLVNHLIYPVPDPRFPFLGVHLTRRIDGLIEAGPNAVLAFGREGYRRRDVVPGDVWDMLRDRGFWSMALRYWRTGIAEMHRSLSKRAFVSGLARLVPEIRASDLERAGAGVRAMAVGADGSIIDDFRIERSGRMVHVLNAPSPAATSALAIGRHIVSLLG
jgi:L-2-hydroxyglutarate oxidase